MRTQPATQPKRLKRGTRIMYRYAFGKMVPGRIVGRYAGLGDDWYSVRLIDEAGEYGGGAHIDAITVIDNRATQAAA